MKKQYMNPSMEVVKLSMEKAVLITISGEGDGYADSRGLLDEDINF